MSWIEIPENSDFTIENIPFGIFSTPSRPPRVGVAIGDQILDLYRLSSFGVFDDMDFEKSVLSNLYLNDFISSGKSFTTKIRWRIQQWLQRGDSPLKDLAEDIMVPQDVAIMHLPVRVGDYTDFYSSEEHAGNVGKMFRDPDNALLPNWKHMPVAYHGRSSSIVISGTDIRRPNGQTMTKMGQLKFGPTEKLDFELEVATVIGKNSEMGKPVPTEEAADYIFGFLLFNDWSARDIQKWEYVPLGPFLGKNFASSVSPWVITLEALHFARVKGPEQNPPVLPYLQFEGRQNFDITLVAGLMPVNGKEEIICHTNFRFMYWNVVQQLAHHTINGCNVNVGDLLASGTISGKNPGSFGSMLELSWSGMNPLFLQDGSKRTFLEDGDTVFMRGYAKQGEKRVGFGEIRNQIIPAG